MRDGIRGVAALGLGLFVVIGCSGGGGGAGSASAQAPATPVAASDGTAGGGDSTATPGAEASAPTTATEPPSGGGTAAGVCELVTADELAGIFGVPSVKTTVFPGPPDNCIVESDAGDPLTAWSLTTAQARAVFDAFASDPSSVEVSGIGDKASIAQNTGLLVLKGDNLLVISISGGADMSEEEGIEASKQIGAIAAGRL
jgi:hypothetical protein